MLLNFNAVPSFSCSVDACACVCAVAALCCCTFSTIQYCPGFILLHIEVSVETHYRHQIMSCHHVCMQQFTVFEFRVQVAFASSGAPNNHHRNLAIGLAVPLGILAALLLFCCCFLLCLVSLVHQLHALAATQFFTLRAC